MTVIFDALPALAAAAGGAGAAGGTFASIGGWSTLISAAGVGVSALADYQANKFNAKVANNNAIIEERNAARARQRSQVEQQDQDFVARAIMGEQIAKQSASGLTGNIGTKALQRKDTKVLARRDALRIRQGGELEANNYLTSAASFRTEAQLNKMAASNALLSGGVNLAGTLVSGATSVNKRKAASVGALYPTDYRTRY